MSTEQVRRVDGCTMEFRVPDLPAGIEFYARLFGRPPDFWPHNDFVEWEIFDRCWFQLGQGDPRPTYAVRLRVQEIDREVERLRGDLVQATCSSITRIPGLVAFCDIVDPWGNRVGLYQRLFVEIPAV